MSGDRLSYVLEMLGGDAAVSDLQKVGQAGASSQTQLQASAAQSQQVLAATGQAGLAAGAGIEAGANKGSTMLGRMSDRLGVTESTLRTGIAGAAAVGFGALVAKAGDAINSYVELAGEVRNLQRVTGGSAEESSRLVAVLDDLQIGSEKASAGLVKLAKASPEKLAQFGIEVERAADGTVSLTETLLNAADAYAATEDPQQRVLLGNAAFGKSYQDLIPLLEQGRAGLQSYFDGVSAGQTLTQKQLDQTREYELAMDALSDAAGDLGLAFGEKVVPALTSAVELGASVVGFFSSLPGPLVSSALAAAAMGAAGVGLNKGLEMLAGQASGVGRLSGALSSVGRFGVAGVAIGAAIPLVAELSDGIRSLLVQERDVSRLTVSLQALGTTGASGGAFADMGGIEAFEDAISELRDAGMVGNQGDWLDWLSSVGTSDFSQQSEDIEALDAALSGLVGSGDIDAAAASWDMMTAAAERQGISAEQLAEIFPQYADAVTDADLAQQGAAESGGALAEATAAAQEVLDFAADAAGRLSGELDTLNGKSLSLAEADIAMRDAVASFNEEVTKNEETLGAAALSLDRNTQAGRDNESALIDQIGVATQFADATAKATGSTEAGRQAFQDQIGSIRENMLALGFNAEQVDTLIATYGRIPKDVRTQVQIDDQASATLATITAGIKGIAGKIFSFTTKNTVETFNVPMTEPRRASGGAVAAGTDYLVGEVRPELFRPAVPGTIVPNTGPAGGGGDNIQVTLNAVPTVPTEDQLVTVMRRATLLAGRR